MKIGRIYFFIIVFWLGMTGWLVRYEAFPQWFTHTFGGYKSMFQGRPFILDSWMQITFKDEPIGYSHTWVDSDIESQTESHRIRNKTILNLNVMGEDQSLTVLADIVLDAEYRVQTFSTLLHSRAYKTRIEGQRTGDGLFEATIETPAGRHTMSLPLPDDVVIYSPMTELAVSRLRPGETMRFRVLDPVSMTVSEVVTEAIRRETLHEEGRDVDTIVLKVTYMGLDMLSWIDQGGRVIKHETPFGWVMTARSASHILTTPSTAFHAGDMLSAMAVPVRGAVVNPRLASELKIRLHGTAFTPEELVTHRQSAMAENGYIAMTIRAQTAPARPAALNARPPEDVLEFLAASPAIQSDHPDIVRVSSEIVSGASNRYAAALAISEWIDENIQKRSTLSLPSALDVLKQKEGDCNEITYLFTALARAVGIPARVHVGLVYAELSGIPGFYYHAWPSVFAGEWVELDPTWGQPTVDASHISLVTGELAEQMKLSGIFGRASIEIIGEDKP